MPTDRSNRSWRWVLGVSLVVNLALTALALGWRGFRPATAAAAPSPAPRSVLAPPSRVIPTNPPVSPTVVTNELPFRWAMLESTNFAVYVANLRSVGCPEPVLRDMIAEELKELYRPGGNASSGDFWEHGEARHQKLRAAAQEGRRRERECRAVYRALLGVDWPVQEMRDPVAVALGQVLGDFLPSDQLDEAAGAIKRLEDESGWIRGEAGGLPLREDDEKQLALYRQWYNEVQARLSPGAWEEILLRTMVVQDGVHENQLGELQLTGPEAREVFRVLLAGTDPVFNAFAQSAGLPDGYRNDTNPLDDPARLAELKRLLGPDRAATLDRNRDPIYGPIRDFVNRRGLPRDTAVQLYESRRLVEKTMRAMAMAHGFTDTERQTYLQELVAAAELAARQTVPAEMLPEYLKQQQEWANRVLEGKP